MAFTRTSPVDFSLANPLYAAATVAAYQVDASGNQLQSLAPLWADLSSAAQLPNPQTLDSSGKFKAPVYIDQPVVFVVSGLLGGVASHQTGVVGTNLAADAAAAAATSAQAAVGYMGIAQRAANLARSIYNKLALAFPTPPFPAGYVKAISSSVLSVVSVATMKGDLGLGSAAALNAGNAAGNVPVLQNNGAAVGLPALDGSLLTGTVHPVVRQTVLDGPVDANGVSATIAASATALGVDLKATSSGGITVTWANGFSSAQVDILQTIPLDLANYWAALPTANTSYLAMDYAGAPAAPTAVQTLAPPQVGRTYSQAAQSVLQFGGAPGSTTFLDDFGNTWTAQGGAKVQNTQFKFGTGALGGGGAGGALNGTTDYLKSTSFQSLGPNGWAMRCWCYATALPASPNIMQAMAVGNSGDFGAEFGIYNNAGTIRWAVTLSSNGSSTDIAANVVGTSTPAINTWYFVELTFDALAGVYRLYVNGTQEATVASTARICAFPLFTIGAGPAPIQFWTGYIDKPEILPYCQHPGGTAYIPPAAAPNVAAAGYASDWFDTVNYQMKSVSGPSVAAGANPPFAQKNRLYIGEADTAGGVVSAVRPYAIAGEYVSPWVAPLPASGTFISKNDNMGTDQKDAVLETQNLTADQGYGAGQIVTPFSQVGAGLLAPFVIVKQRNLIGFNTASGNAGGTGQWQIAQAVSGGDVAMVVANWQYRLRSKRRW